MKKITGVSPNGGKEMFETLPGAVLTALARLQDAGVEGVLVGGCVRDALMGLPPHDYDIAAGASPQRLKAIFSDYPLILDGEKHGTITPVIDHTPVEITSFRTEAGYQDGRPPDQVHFDATRAQDLTRRDFDGITLADLMATPLAVNYVI